MDQPFKECSLCLKYKIGFCSYVDIMEDGSFTDPSTDPRSFGRFVRTRTGENHFNFIVTHDLSLEDECDNDDKQPRSFKECIEAANKAVDYYPLHRENDDYEQTCLARGIALEFENHRSLLINTINAIRFLIDHPDQLSGNCQVLYNLLTRIETRILVIKVLSVQNSLTLFSALQMLNSSVFDGLHELFINTLISWIEHIQYRQDVEVADWYEFSKLLATISIVLSVVIERMPQPPEEESTSEDEHKRSRVSLVERQNLIIPFIENSYLIPLFSSCVEKDNILSLLVDVSRKTDLTRSGVSLDFINSLATSFYLSKRVCVEHFEITDKTYVLANAFKSIEELLSCCLVLIDSISNSNTSIVIKCFVKGLSVEYPLHDYQNWLQNATIGNLNGAIGSICKQIVRESKYRNLSSDIYNWTNQKRNGFFHKHGLVYNSWEEMLSGDEKKSIPSLSSLLESTIELASKIIEWTDYVCSIVR